MTADQIGLQSVLGRVKHRRFWFTDPTRKSLFRNNILSHGTTRTENSQFSRPWLQFQTHQRMRIDCNTEIVTSGWCPWIKNVSAWILRLWIQSRKRHAAEFALTSRDPHSSQRVGVDLVFLYQPQTTLVLRGKCKCSQKNKTLIRARIDCATRSLLVLKIKHEVLIGGWLIFYWLIDYLDWLINWLFFDWLIDWLIDWCCTFSETSTYDVESTVETAVDFVAADDWIALRPDLYPCQGIVWTGKRNAADSGTKHVKRKPASFPGSFMSRPRAR